MMLRSIGAAKGLMARSLSQTTSYTQRAFIHVGDQIPNVELHKGFPPEKVNLRDFCKGSCFACLHVYMFLPVFTRNTLSTRCHRQVCHYGGTSGRLYSHVIDQANSKLQGESRRSPRCRCRQCISLVCQ